MTRPQDGNGVPDTEIEGGLLDDVKAGFEEVKQREEAAAPAEGKASPEAEATAAALRGEPPADDKAKPAPAAASDGRARGPDGKFIKSDGAPPTPDQAAPAPAGGDGTAPPPVAAAPAPADPADPQPPEHWSQLDKDRFQALPKEIRPLYLEQRVNLEKGFQEKFTAVASKVKAADAIHEVFAPIAEDLRPYNWGPVEATKYLVSVFQNMRRDPRATLAKLASDYGIDPATLAAPSGAQPAPNGAAPGQPTGATPLEFLDPAAERGIADVRAQIAPVAQAVQQITQTLQQQAQAAQQAEIARVHAHVTSFAAAKGPDGKPLHPYYDEVRPIMANLMTAGQARTIEEAYDQACRLHPEVYAAQERAREAAWNKKVEDERKANLARARGGAPAPASAPAATVAREQPAKPKRDNVKADLLAAWNEAQPRV